MASLIRIGPEHFLTPILLSQKHNLFKSHKCDVELIPQPSGTGQMITSYREGKIDIAIGLTEGWINGLATYPDLYRLVGTYVKSPLCWAISTGVASRYRDASELRDQTIGVSRIGSGSYVMSFVFADQRHWLTPPSSSSSSAAAVEAGTEKGSGEEGDGRTGIEAPFKFIKLDTFKGLRDGVNDNRAAAFMWERFTTKKYYDSQEIRNIGELYTPWPSWLITASTSLLSSSSATSRVSNVLNAIDEGIAYYYAHKEDAMALISTELDYSRSDAEEWSDTVEFAGNVREIDEGMVNDTIKTLRKAGLMTERKEISASDMIQRIP